MKEITFKKGCLKFAVIGHVEWINFLMVDSLPNAGGISHANKSFEEVAGGGAVIAKTLKELTYNEVHFFTSLGRDYYGDRSFKALKSLGLKVHVAWREFPTRKGFSLIDNNGDRAITIIGDRLSPKHQDNLNWNILNEVDGIFITAGDKELFMKSRQAKVVCTTPRVGIEIINKSNILLDALISSNLDPGEKFSSSELRLKPRLIIKTEGDQGGIVIPGGRYNAIKNDNKEVDSYGCGDSFAAGVLFGLSSNWDIDDTINLGKVLGRNCIENFGPYPNMDNIIKN